ncbi:hypothetical protein GIB67_009228 [Kingdonia uniflora]|uniref:Telomere repeat-binding protein 1-6-like ubiquitin-like domain-containing protein n=1 Tax=Kingdonia uniflora TaxID=39325 RepID=A0A7J7N2B8_9MAGN|nr:hypothetical protein GIB67_009228 [Kingdonia uniflora]
MLGRGLHVGVILEGKQARDDNRTLLQTGILHDDKLDSLGFTLQSNPPPPSLSNFNSAMTKSANGIMSCGASSSTGEESSSHSRDPHGKIFHIYGQSEKLNINRTRLPKLSIEIPETTTFAVKLRIKSFRVPELTIEIPKTATRTVAEAVTTMPGGGLQVGIVLQGEQVRDENGTLLLTGLLHDDKLDSLGITLQPKPYPSPPLLCDEDPSFLVHCSTPQPLTRYLTTPLDQGGCLPKSSYD